MSGARRSGEQAAGACRGRVSGLMRGVRGADEGGSGGR